MMNQRSPSLHASRSLWPHGLGAVLSALTLALGACAGDGDRPMVGVQADGGSVPGAHNDGGLSTGTMGDAMMTMTGPTGDGGVVGDASGNPQIQNDAGMMQPDLCIGVQCGTGKCNALSGAAACDCPAHTIGDACETCARGYKGAACATCDDGYVDDGSGGCITDPCATMQCGMGGTCVSIPPRDPICECRENFTGTQCERCSAGHTGPTCTDCLAGYTRVGGICRADVCFQVSCGVGGFCIARNNAPVCSCRTGYMGDDCATCWVGWTKVGNKCEQTLPPTTAALDAWYDGAAPSTMDITADGYVTEWRSRNRPQDPLKWWAQSGTFRPRYSSATRGIVFDKDEMFSYSGMLGAYPHYTIFIVMRWNQGVGRQTVLRFIDMTQGKHVGRIFVDGGKAGFLHTPNGAAPVDLAEGTFYAGASGPQLIIARRAPVGNSVVHNISDGKQNTNVVAKAGPHLRRLVPGMGAHYQDPPEDAFLYGTMHELVVFAGALSAAEQKAVIDYLTVKWGL